jgi:hypothetical protein
LSDREESPVFRPRFGKRDPRASARQSSLRNVVLALMCRGVRRQPRSHGPTGDLRTRVPGARRVIVKAHFVRLTASGAKAAKLHLRYIERDGGAPVKTGMRK